MLSFRSHYAQGEMGIPNSNRFEVLTSMDSSDEEQHNNHAPPAWKAPPHTRPAVKPLKKAKPPCTIQQTYHLIMGSEPITSALSQAGTYSYTANNVWGEPLINESNHMQRSVSFFGRCFQCQYMSHSQKYCPLQLCTKCGKFGHSENVCA